MGWANWIVWTMRLWLLAKRYGPTIASLYSDIMAMIRGLEAKGFSAAMLAYYKSQAKDELDKLRVFKSKDPTNLQDLHAVVKSSIDRGVP